MTSIKIGHVFVGEYFPTYIIADIGSNHDQKKERAFNLIKAAKDAGANAAKFQFFKGEILFPKDKTKAKSCKPFETSRTWIEDLWVCCKREKIDFMASVFDEEAFNLIDPYVYAHKIASSELVNHKLIALMDSTRKPIILATGMSDLVDVFEAVDKIKEADFALLQCTADYPTKPIDVNLKVMDSYRATFSCVTGLSDHTPGSLISCAAVARGASIIEKHITDDNYRQGPDHHYALTLSEFRQAVKNIRTVEESLGLSLKKLCQGERKYVRGVRHGR